MQSVFQPGQRLALKQGAHTATVELVGLGSVEVDYWHAKGYPATRDEPETPEEFEIQEVRFNGDEITRLLSDEAFAELEESIIEKDKAAAQDYVPDSVLMDVFGQFNRVFGGGV